MAPFDFHTTSDTASNALKAAIVGKTSQLRFFKSKFLHVLNLLTCDLTIVVITGVSPNSLGADTARSIVAQKPAQLILASQTEAKLQEVIKSLEIPEGTTVRPLVLDLASLESVRRAAKEVLDRVTSINALICTAGIMAVPSYSQSKDGIELQFAVNHLGHFSFVNLLIEKLIAGNATVVTYSSEAHTRANPTFLDDLTYDNGKDYEKWTAYSNSKLCNIAHAAGLAKRYGPRGLRAFSVDPGIIVTTALTRSVPQEDFIAMGKSLFTDALDVCLRPWTNRDYTGWADANGNLSSAIKTKTSAEGSSTGIIAAFDRSLSSLSPTPPSPRKLY